MVEVKPLMVVMGVRWIPICKYWIDKINFLPKLIIDGFLHSESHRIMKKYFLEHSEYTHLLIYGEDTVYTPNHVNVLIQDAKEYDYDVVSGWTNVNYKMSLSNVGMADLRKTTIIDYKQYKLLDIFELMNYKENDVFIKCFFVGLPLTLMKRKVVEKVSFEPYKFIQRKIGNQFVREGIMHDTQFAIECANNNIQIIVDKRLFGIHYGDTTFLIKPEYYKRQIKLIEPHV